jgi:hypothetical protein
MKLKPRFPQSTDASLTVLLGVQAFTLFVAIPLDSKYAWAHLLLDLCHLLFAMVCVLVLTQNRVLQASLLIALALLAAAPTLSSWLLAHRDVQESMLEETIALTVFVFNAAVTTIVAIHVFGPGQVTGHRVRGAILLYLNVAALFSIAFGAIEAHAPGAITTSGGGTLAATIAARTATLNYFSLTTITTTGYGDLMPVDPLARSLANLESVFGQLFPATLLARLVALHVAHSGDASKARAEAKNDGKDEK